MKTIISILAIVIICTTSCTTTSRAQVPSPGSYITNTTMGAFHGTWMWTSDTDTVKIYLATKKVYIPEDRYYTDLLIGWHLYKRGNTVIESSYSYINNIGARTIELWNDKTANNPKVEGMIVDLSKSSKDNMLYLTLNGAQNQITWRCTEQPGRIFPASQTLPPAGVTLPRNIVLMKQ